MVNKEIIKDMIQRKEEELKAVIERASQNITEGQKLVVEAVLMRLNYEITDLNKQLLDEGEHLPSKESLLQLIDEALDNKDKAEFMKLTNLLNAMN